MEPRHIHIIPIDTVSPRNIYSPILISALSILRPASRAIMVDLLARHAHARMSNPAMHIRGSRTSHGVRGCDGRRERVFVDDGT